MSATCPEEHAALAAAARVDAPTEVLTLRIGAEEYGVDILRVQEIRSYEAPTRIAGAPPHILGVTNLRGTIVPLVDLRQRLGVADGSAGAGVIVVLNLARRTVGAVVDAVSDVVALAEAEVHPAPQLDGRQALPHVIGLATLRAGDRQRLLILVDVAVLLQDAGSDPA